MRLQAPNESERYEILDVLLADSILACDVSLSTLATQTAALVASDLVDLVERAQLISIQRVMSATYEFISIISCLPYDSDQVSEPEQGAEKFKTGRHIFNSWRLRDRSRTSQSVIFTKYRSPKHTECLMGRCWWPSTCKVGHPGHHTATTGSS